MEALILCLLLSSVGIDLVKPASSNSHEVKVP